MTVSGLEHARRAKRDLGERLATVTGVVGIGVTREREQEGYAVVVRLAHHVAGLPGTVTVATPDGGEVEITVYSEVVGPVRPE